MIRKTITFVLGMLIILSACTSPPQPEPTQITKQTSPPEKPTPTIEYDTPNFIPIPNQILLSKDTSLTIDLTEFVFGIEHNSNQVTWKAEANPELSIRFDGPVMHLETAVSNWHSNTPIKVEVCNPGEKCGITEIELSVVGDIESGIFHTQIDGIIIEFDGVKIMIDALFTSPDGTDPKHRQAMLEALPPYDDPDIILITHHHHDHFNAELTVQNMIHNPEAILISTNLVVEQMAEIKDFDQIGDRVIGLEATPGMNEIVNAAGTDIEVLYLSHGNIERTPNFAYLFTLDGHTFFHTGDVVLDEEPLATFIDYRLPEKSIDYAFVPYFMLTTTKYFPYANEGIAARYLIPVHISTHSKRQSSNFETMESNFENLLLFKQDYSWYSFDQ